MGDQNDWSTFIYRSFYLCCLFVGAGMYKDNVKRLISINISTSGVFLDLVFKSFYNDSYEPIVVAMVLTVVVISAAFSVLGVIIIIG